MAGTVFMTRRTMLAAMGVAAVATMSQEAIAQEAVEEQQADVVVVGAGISGAAAAAQAAELGMRVVVLEKMPAPGGNGQNTEGVFGSNSPIQQEQGSEPITFRQVIQSEQEFFNYRVNNLLWKDLVEASGDNIAWLMEKGVEFSGEVDTYGALGKLAAFHWFKDGSGTNCVMPLLEAAQANGAEVLLECPATGLIVEDGAVVGVEALDADGVPRRIRSGAVILATGGYAGNAEMMAERGRSLEHALSIGMPGHDGDGLRMAIEAGAHDVSRQRAFLAPLGTQGWSFFGQMNNLVHHGGPVLWVNQDGRRYTNENCGARVDGCLGNAVHTQKASFVVLGAESVDALARAGSYPDLVDELAAAALESDGEGVHVAQTISELGTMLGFEPEVFEAEVARYNDLCAAGQDDDYAKESEMMVPVATPPFYGVRQDFVYATSIGGIDTDASMRVLDQEGNPIDGLFAVGVDGCNLYRETYTISVPASCNANNINSGRIAARAAAGLSA